MGEIIEYVARPNSRRFEIDKEELEKLVWEMPCTEIAKLYGVSDKAIERRCKLLNIEKPPRGYWQRKNQSKNFKIKKN